jgi:hypothetical protein
MSLRTRCADHGRGSVDLCCSRGAAVVGPVLAAHITDAGLHALLIRGTAVSGLTQLLRLQ